MLQSKGRYSLDCINDVTCGSVWGTITTLENIDEAVQQRGAGKRIRQRSCDLAGDRRKPARTGQNRHGAAGRIKAGDHKTESGDLRHSFKEW